MHQKSVRLQLQTRTFLSASILAFASFSWLAFYDIDDRHARIIMPARRSSSVPLQYLPKFQNMSDRAISRVHLALIREPNSRFQVNGLHRIFRAKDYLCRLWSKFFLCVLMITKQERTSLIFSLFVYFLRSIWKHSHKVAAWRLSSFLSVERRW